MALELNFIWKKWFELKLWMALELNFIWKKWFEYYNIEFGTYDGTFVLYSKNI